MFDIESMTVRQLKEIQRMLGTGKSPRKKERVEGGIRIVILQRGWIFVGRYSSVGDDCKLEGASVIRIWGTTNGLGEIALGGPTSSTKLDPTPTVYFHKLTEVASLQCTEEKWAQFVK